MSNGLRSFDLRQFGNVESQIIGQIVNPKNLFSSATGKDVTTMAPFRKTSFGQQSLSTTCIRIRFVFMKIQG